MAQLWQGFEQYLADRAPTDTEKGEVRRYRQRIHDVLRSQFRLMAFFQSGSFQHGTAITPYSDVDYIARVYFEDRPLSSSTVLNTMRDLFKRELWEATSVSVARPTVTIQFPSIVARYEITPAYLKSGLEDSEQVLHIPASAGEWRESAPKAHNAFVSDMDRKHHGNVRVVARLLKAWKYKHGVPISSFYLEMRAAEFGKNHDHLWPLSALRAIAAKLLSTELASMNDPTRMVSRIAANSSETDRRVSLAKLRTLKAQLDVAYEAWCAGQSQRWEMNQALQKIWGAEFLYCDTSI